MNWKKDLYKTLIDFWLDHNLSWHDILDALGLTFLLSDEFSEAIEEVLKERGYDKEVIEDV